MFTFIIFIIFALAFGYFATQNTQTISITLANYTISKVPLYIVLGVTLLIGLALSWINSLLDSLITSFTIRDKEHTIKDSKTKIRDLTKRINQLEIENAELKGELKHEVKDANSI